MKRMTFVVEVDAYEFDAAVASAKCGADEFVALAIAERMTFELSDHDEGCSARVVVNGCAVTYDKLPELDEDEL